jgi:molybdate transport system substrate-binding protein
MRRRTQVRGGLGACAALATLVVVSGCGSSSSSSSTAGSSTSPTAPTVLAAASLAKVFPKIDPAPDYSFGGSGALATQIEQGAPADVFAAASAKQPAALLAKGLIEHPVKFATNRLVMVVPAANPAHLTSVNGITAPGVKVVICAASVPCGDYARNVFKNLGITTAAMQNVVSNASDVAQVVAQVALGQADAGFVYITDANAADGKVTAIALPDAAKPKASDYVAIVKAGANQRSATAFVAEVLSPRGQAILRSAGFGAP